MIYESSGDYMLYAIEMAIYAVHFLNAMIWWEIMRIKRVEVYGIILGSLLLQFVQ